MNRQGSCWALIAAVAVVACDSQADHDVGSKSSGGSTNTGGTGGSLGSGGTVQTGGSTPGTGGATPDAGGSTPGTGGQAGTGGADAGTDVGTPDGSVQTEGGIATDAGSNDASADAAAYEEPRPPGPQGTVTFYLTNVDESAKFAEQPTLTLGDLTNSDPTITIDDKTTYQTMDGFGLAMTNGSAEAISSLPAETQDAVLKDLFDPVSGIGMSLVRVSIGASDLNSSLYFYDTTADDVEMKDFSLTGPDTQFLIPVLKKAIAIYPNLKILGSPWSAPPWMKSNNDTVGGNLLTNYYAAYALYFRKYLEAMRDQGLGLWAVTVQNEPLNGNNNPSMVWTPDEEANFINDNLGPTLKAAGLTTKIITYDHNCDRPDYPITVCSKASQYVAGAAFHLYGGDISALSEVHDTTGKDVWFTEQWTGAGQSIGSMFDWHMREVQLGTVNNWGRGTIEWNIASFGDWTPHTDRGGCPSCMGAIVVDGTNVRNELAYYVVAHMSKFIRPNAVRVASTSTDDSLVNAAFVNDGVVTIVVLNTGDGSKTFNVAYGGSRFSATLDGQSAGTFTWDTLAP